MTWDEYLTPGEGPFTRRPMGELLVELAERTGRPVFPASFVPASGVKADHLPRSQLQEAVAPVTETTAPLPSTSKNQATGRLVPTGGTPQ